MKKQWIAAAALILFVGLGGVVGCLNDNNPSAPPGGQYAVGPPPPTSTFTLSPTPTVTATFTLTPTSLLSFVTATPTATL